MKIGNFTFLSYNVLTQIIKTFIAKKELLSEPLLNSFEQEKIEILIETFEKSPLPQDEKELILTGALIQSLAACTPGPNKNIETLIEYIKGQFINSSSVYDLVVNKLHDGGEAQCEAIDSYALYKKDPEHYRTYQDRKNKFAKDIYGKYGTDIYGKEDLPGQNIITTAITFFAGRIIGNDFDLNTLYIDGHKFYPYAKLRSTFALDSVVMTELIEEYEKRLGSSYLSSCIMDLKELFQSLNNASIPLHDKSLIATGGLLQLQKYNTALNSFWLSVNNERFLYFGKAKEAAIESYTLYCQNKDKYEIYSHRCKKESSHVVALT